MHKLLYVVSLGLLMPLCSLAQSQVNFNKEKAQPTPERSIDRASAIFKNRKSSSGVTTLWSQDFANGIPGNWQNAGFDMNIGTGVLTPNPLCWWEYRGPSTTPSNSTGSRGVNAGAGPTIQSPTASNGFIIFDSDYLDSDGLSRGNGVSAAPHIGTLSTDTIDLTGYPNVLVAFFSRARNFHSAFKLAVSNDGGLTFPDTVEFHPTLPVNSTSSSGEEVTANISNTAGNQSMVVLQLIYEGFDEESVEGYYYWQIDDIEIREIPNHSLQFVEFNTAPPNDIIYPTGSPEYGNPQVDQTQPITFDSNIYNFGTKDQTNVRLKVTIKDPGGSVVTTLTSPTKALIASGDTGSFIDFTTTSSWTPGATGDYTVVFSTESDSIPSAGVPDKDSLTIRINPQNHGGHFNTYNNDLGSDQDRIALGQAFTFPNSHVDTNGYVFIDGLNIRFSSDSDPDGLVIVEVYDTAGFSYGINGGPTGIPFRVKGFSLDSGSVGNWAFVDLTENGMPLALPSNAGYYVIINLAPSPPDGIIQIGNDQTIVQPTGLIAMQRNDGHWFPGYSNSRSLSNLLIEMVVSEKVSIEEALARQNMVKIYPQPAPAEKVQIEITQGGHYQLELYTYRGEKVYEESVYLNGREVLKRSFNQLSRGAYLLKLQGDNYSTTKKLILE